MPDLQSVSALPEEADPAALGRRVLDSLAKGRRRAIATAQARARIRERLVLAELNREILEGRPARGRAGRIHRRIARQFSHSPNGEPGHSPNGELPVARISVRTVQRILDRLASVSGSLA